MMAFNNKFELAADVQCSDKSLTHRALIVAAIADGESRIHNVTLSRDVLCTVEALRTLGAKVQLQGSTAVVTPITSPPREEVTIHCGNSGTTARLVAGLCAGLGVAARFDGDESLRSRPMDRVVQPLRALGADVSADGLLETHGGALLGREICSEVASAQVKSAVILAGLFAEGETCFKEPLASRNHTEVLLRELGADVRTEGNAVFVRKSVPHCFETTLPNDPSAVAYSVALALLAGRRARLQNVLLNERRLGFVRVLQQAGARLEFVNVHTRLGERVGDIVVEPGELSPFTCNAQQAVDAIDELPLLATMALFVPGRHVFCGVAELAHKECNRIEAIAHLASVCGKRCNYANGTLEIESDGKVPGCRRFRTFGDHRIAMCGTVLSIAAGSGCIDGAPFDVSHPEFLRALGIRPLKLGLIGTHVENSVSPRLQTYLAMRAGVCCGYRTVQLPADISDSDLLHVMEQFDGLNVTMPFKTRVAQLLKADVPSVNTVGKGIRPTSTDGYGLVHPLQRHGVEFCGQPLWIVGAGGAAEAAIAELSKYGCKMQVINRTSEHARALRERYALPSEVKRPVGVLTFVPECPFEQSIALPDSCRFVFVAAYMGHSGVLCEAKRRGLEVVDGVEMNYDQGAMGFSLWTGTPLQDDFNAYIKYIEEFNYIKE